MDWSRFYFLSFVVNSKFSNSHFPVTIHGLDLVSGVYLNMLLCLWCAVVDSSSISEYPRLGVSLSENINSRILKYHDSFKNQMTDKSPPPHPQKLSVNFSHALFSLADFLT